MIVAVVYSVPNVVICIFTLGVWLTHVQVTFAYAAGPLAWSVIAFRNSLVFHSLDKVRCVCLVS